MADALPIRIKSASIKASKWTYDHIFMQYAFSPDGRFVFKWTFVSFLVVDTFYGTSSKFTNKSNENLRIRDFLPLTDSSGLLLYGQGGKTFISVLHFDFPAGNTYELLKPEEILDDCKEYGGNITGKEDDPNRGVIFLTRNYPGDIFIFFMFDKFNQIHFELTVETEDREYSGYGYYKLDCFYYFRMAYGGGERPFEALKLLERREGAKPQTVYFGPMPLMNRRNLMHRTKMPRFQGSWSQGIFYLSVNIDPDQYFTTLNLHALKWTNLEFDSINFQDPRIQINNDRILIVHDESKVDINRLVTTYRIPLEWPESLQMLAFFQIRKNNDFQVHNLQLPLNLSIQQIFKD